jgi:PAS domain S-box-containing protein
MDKSIVSKKEWSINEMKPVKIVEEILGNAVECHHYEKERHNLQNCLSIIINSMPSVIVGVDADGKVTQWNKAAQKATGIEMDAALGKLLSDVFPRMTSIMQKIIESIRTGETIQEQKKPRRIRNDVYYEDVTILPLITNNIKGAVIRVDDMTDKVRMEEMMIQSQKMLALGGLAAGMAHEINSPLSGMMQTANVMANRLSDNINIPANLKAADAAGTTMEAIQNFMENRDILPMITSIKESGQRLAGIIDNMLSFARKSDARVSFYTLSELLDKAFELAATDFKMIEIKKEYDDKMTPVPCEGVKIQQVLLNILRNGAQAMQEAGIEKPLFLARTLVENKRNMVYLEIEDNGPGMDEKTLKRVFDPFFTTKPLGIGTGIGLSVSYYIIVDNHGGEMKVESSLGKGTKFIIKLPFK